MSWSCTATTSNDLHSKVFNEVHHLHLQFGGRESVMGNSTDIFGKTCIGYAAHNERRILREVADMLLHLLRTRCTIKSQNVNGKRF